MDSEQQNRIMKIAEQHAELERLVVSSFTEKIYLLLAQSGSYLTNSTFRRWIFKPDGFLSLSPNDQIVSNSDFWVRFNKYSDKVATSS